MRILEFSADGYKNLKSVQASFHPEMNIIFGENAQGKTNLLEALWICTGCKSFRGTRDKDYIGFDSKKAEISLVFQNKERKQKIDFCSLKENPKEKKVLLNGVKLPLLSRLFGNLKCVIFTPEDLELSKGSPENRRTFLDLSISQIRKGYVSALNQYDHLISQRNALLKEISFGRAEASSLDLWEEQLAPIGSYISLMRYTYVNKLNVFAGKMYRSLAKEKEQLSLSYSSTVFSSLENRLDYKGEMAEEYLQKLRKNREEDIRLGFTGAGVHRDDMTAKINGLSSREFGSQGQNRSVAIVLKLSQAEILLDETGDSPVILLDDVLSELDHSRQDFILNHIKEMQLFVTCCDEKQVLKYKKGNLYEMKEGVMYFRNGGV